MMMVLVCFWNVTGLASSTDVLISLTFVQQTMDSAVLLTLSLWRNNCKIGQNIIFYLMTYQKLLGVLWSLFILRLMATSAMQLKKLEIPNIKYLTKMGWFGRQTSGQPIFFKYWKLGKANFFYCVADVANWCSTYVGYFKYVF